MSAPELLVGSVVVGKYTIRSLLHHGGVMATYRAVAAKNREVVLKIYDPAIAALPDVLKVLAQHQSISAKLPSQYVVRMIDRGTDANWGAPFTVTDFETAPSLAQLIERAPRSTPELTALVRNLAQAVDSLHASGIEELTLHPANVFVSPSAQYESHIADFGATLVRRALPASEKAVRWMPWLAPEQIKAQAPPTRAADVFALGLLAFFAATGKLYWRASQVKTPDVAALRREVLAERMPASVRAGEFAIKLSPAVDAVFARALAFRPADRYATAREFAVALEAALSGRSVAEVDAAQPQSANVPPATAKSSAGGPAAAPAAAPASSSGKVAQAGPRNAPPPPRTMQRATMVGMGSPGAGPPSGPSATASGARLPMSTMLGIGDIGESEIDASLDALEVDARLDALEVEVTKVMPAKAVAAAMAPAKPAAPATPTAKVGAPAAAPAPAKGSAPAMTAAAKAEPPAMARTAVLTSPAMPAAAAKPQPPPMPAMPVVQAGTVSPATPAAAAKPQPPPMPVVPAMPIVQAGTVSPATPAAAAKPQPPPMPVVPAMPIVQAGTVVPAMPVVQAGAAVPAMPIARAAVPPTAAASDPHRRGPPTLPMTPPPPAQMTDVLAKFEAGPSDPSQGAGVAASSAARGADVVQASPLGPAATLGDFGAERVETGVAVIGADFVAETPKSSRWRWIAGVSGLLVLTGGVAFALSGSSKGPSSRERTAPRASETTVASTAATQGVPHASDPAGPTLLSAAANAVAEGPAEPQAAATLEPVAPAPPPPAVHEPEPAAPAPAPPPLAVAEPATPTGDVNSAREPSMTPPRRAVDTLPTPAAAPAPHPATPKKNCGKFLKRCK